MEIPKITERTTKIALISIAVGIWVIVLQNAGVIPTSQNVEVTNGVHVYGTVDIDDIRSTVGVSGYVDVNLEAINGKSNVFYDFGGNKEYIRIPVYTGDY